MSEEAGPGIAGPSLDLVLIRQILGIIYIGYLNALAPMSFLYCIPSK